MEHGLMLMQGAGTAIRILAADPQPGSGNATLWAAGIAAGASLLSLLVSSVIAVKQKKSEKNAKEIERCQAQLGELYGPLSARRLKSSSLYSVLRQQMGVAPADQEDWRLVDHIVDVRTRGSDLAKSAVTKILAINAEVETLVTQHWGLLETSTPHESFNQFFRHVALLQHAWEEGVNQESTTRTTFPRDLDQDIEADVAKIRARLKNLISA